MAKPAPDDFEIANKDPDQRGRGGDRHMGQKIPKDVKDKIEKGENK